MKFNTTYSKLTESFLIYKPDIIMKLFSGLKEGTDYVVHLDGTVETVCLGSFHVRPQLVRNGKLLVKFLKTVGTRNNILL